MIKVYTPQPKIEYLFDLLLMRLIRQNLTLGQEKGVLKQFKNAYKELMKRINNYLER